MSDQKLLIIDDVHPYLNEELDRAGIPYIYAPSITRAEILETLPRFTGLVVRSKTPVDRELIGRGTSLRFIARAGSGMDNVDEEFATSRGIYCFNVPEANSNAVGEHALALLLSLTNRIVPADRQVKSGTWDREGNRGFELKGKKAGIIGYGHTGSAFARKLAGLDMQVLAYDIYKSGFSSGHIQEASLQELLAEADVISLHVPLTAETRHMVNAAFIGQAAKPFWLINTSRGPVVDTAGLLEGLENGKVRGAGLDVLENEKINKLDPQEQIQLNRLSALPQVVITPHVAGWSTESYYLISYYLTLKILAYVSTTQTTKDQRNI